MAEMEGLLDGLVNLDDALGVTLVDGVFVTLFWIAAMAIWCWRDARSRMLEKQSSFYKRSSAA